jgi:hypothetical protein
MTREQAVELYERERKFETYADDPDAAAVRAIQAAYAQGIAANSLDARALSAPEAAPRQAPDGVHEALQRLIENAAVHARPGQRSDGAASIQAHHHDYSKPLDVEWLCSKCHRVETPLPEVMGGKALGVVNGQAKLTPDAVRQIRARTESSRKLAKEFGVGKTTIVDARSGALWSHVK